MTTRDDDRDNRPSATARVSPIEGAGAGRGRVPAAALSDAMAYRRLTGSGPGFWSALCTWRDAVRGDRQNDPLLTDDIDPPHTFPREKTAGRSAPFDD